MADHDNQYLRWVELMDRKVEGFALSDEELLFCKRYAAEHPACGRELELFEELADLDVAPNAESRALVDATLARLAAEAASAEQNELSEIKRGGRWPRFVWMSGAAALAATAAAVLLMPHKPAVEPVAALQDPAPRVELVYAAGDVRVGGKPVSGGSMLLAEGSVLEVGRGSACVAMDPEINVCAGEQSRLRLSRTHSAWRKIDLESGEVAVQLAPQPEGWRLSVVADGVWSTAVGTAFSVQRDDAEGVRTTVLNGKVRVGSDGGSEQLVAAHQRAQVRGGRSQLDAISRSDESPEWALLRPSKLWSNPVSATLEVRGLPASAAIALDDQVIGVAPLSSVVPAGTHKLGVLIDGHVVATREFMSEVGQLTSLVFEGEILGVPAATEINAQPEVVQATVRPTIARQHVAKKPEPEPEPVAQAAVVPAAGEMLAQARRLMRAERFGEAAVQYQALRQTYPDSAEARTVLVSLAEVQLDRLGQPQQALDGLERYLSGGSGSLIEEARRVRIRALQALGNQSRERTAIEEFLRAHPKSFQAAALQHRLVELKTQP
jgi:hypothetical protein